MIHGAGVIAPDEGHVDAAVQQLPVELPGVGVDHLAAHIGALHPEPDQLVRQGVFPVGIGGANGDDLAAVFPHLLQVAAGLLQKAQINLRLLRQILPLGGEFQPLGRPFHNGHIKLRLDVLQALGQRGLGDVEHIGNLGQIGVLIQLVQQLPVKILHNGPSFPVVQLP